MQKRKTFDLLQIKSCNVYQLYSEAALLCYEMHLLKYKKERGSL